MYDMHICVIVHTFHCIVQCFVLLFHFLVEKLAHTYEKQGSSLRYFKKFAIMYSIFFIFRMINQFSGYFALFLVYWA
jgi:hypothetical protein